MRANTSPPRSDAQRQCRDGKADDRESPMDSQRSLRQPRLQRGAGTLRPCTTCALLRGTLARIDRVPLKINYSLQTATQCDINKCGYYMSLSANICRSVAMLNRCSFNIHNVWVIETLLIANSPTTLFIDVFISTNSDTFLRCIYGATFLPSTTAKELIHLRRGTVLPQPAQGFDSYLFPQ